MRAGDEHPRARAVVRAFTVDIDQVGPLKPDPQQPFRVGRSPTANLRFTNPAVPRDLATIRATDAGWVLENGSRTFVTAESLWVQDVVFHPGGALLLQTATWTLTWDLDILCAAVVWIQSSPAATTSVRGRGDSQDDQREVGDNSAHHGTLVAGEQVELTVVQRRRLAALFAYLIEDGPRPSRMLHEGAARAGETPEQINRTFIRVRDRVNAYRHGVPISSMDDLGRHLVHVAGVLGPDDLPSS